MRKRNSIIAAGLATAAIILAINVPSIAAGGGPQGPAKAAGGQYPGGDPACNFNGLTTATNLQVITAVRTTSEPRTYGSTAWMNVACADLTILVPRGKSTLIVATVTAELGCYGELGTYCQGRILIDNVESYPRAPDPSSFAWASADPQAVIEDAGWQKWTSGTMTKSRIFTCPANYAETRCPVRIQPQAKLSDQYSSYSMWIDDLHTTVTATTNS